MPRFARRKWGWYLTLLDRKRFKIKLLRFWGGLSCSRQYHKHRNELWLFLTGSGLFNRRSVSSGNWRHVPIGYKHQYKADKPTWVLELQYGRRCVEEDIVRI